MFDIVVLRDLFFDGQAILGTCLIYDKNGKQVFKKESLERGWVNNENRVSCIPPGVYECVLEYSDKFRKDLWELKGVSGRSECKFHAANYWHQLNGCVALGNNRKYIDRDLVMDVTSSRDTMAMFHKVLEGENKCQVTIIDVLKTIRP